MPPHPPNAQGGSATDGGYRYCGGYWVWLSFDVFYGCWYCGGWQCVGLLSWERERQRGEERGRIKIYKNGIKNNKERILNEMVKK